MTPFQWEGMWPRETLERRADALRKALRGVKGVALRLDSVRWAFVQAVLARGDRRLGEAIIGAEERGGGIGAWRRALADFGTSLWEAPTRPIPAAAELPWGFIDFGGDHARWLQEKERALARTIHEHPAPDGEIVDGS
jgi:hypothetical protein